MGKTGIIVAVIAVLALAGGVLALSRKSANKQPQTANSSTPTTTNSPAASSNTAPTAGQVASQGTISYLGNGFSPASLVVKSGSKVTISNNSSNMLQFNSTPHPAHTDDPELNVGVIAPGQSKTITVTRTGSHGYHNHINPGDTGTLVVQ